MSTPTPVAPPSSAAPTKKVTAATVGGYVAGVLLLGILQAVGAHPDVLSGLPSWVDVFVAPVIPALIAGVSGYVKRETPPAP